MRGFGILLAMCVPAVAVAVPPLIQHQGRLADNLGQPIEGTQQLTFRLYDSAADDVANAFWSEQRTVELDGGYFSVQIGNGLNPALLDRPQVWLGISLGTDDELPGRQRVTAVPYAMVADTAERLRCPADMVDAGAFCIDVDDNGEADWQAAASACVAEGKRLCSMAEWIGACNLAGTLGLQDMTDNLEYVDEYWVMNYTNGNYYSAYVSVGGGSCARVHYSGWGCSNGSCYDTTHPGRSSGYYSRCCR